MIYDCTIRPLVCTELRVTVCLAYLVEEKTYNTCTHRLLMPRAEKTNFHQESNSGSVTGSPVH